MNHAAWLSYAIFDMDGLMFDTERLFVESFLRCVAPRTGMDFPADKLKQMLGMNWADTMRVFPTLFGTKYSCEACYAISREWVNDYIGKNGVPVKPGLLELLDYLRAHKFRIALATGSDREKAVRYTRSVGIFDRFDVILGGDMVVRGKPDPEIFQKTAQALGCSDPAACVVFEDSRNGMLAAERGGFQVIIVPDLIDPTSGEKKAWLAKVACLAEAIPVLEQQRQKARPCAAI